MFPHQFDLCAEEKRKETCRYIVIGKNIKYIVMLELLALVKLFESGKYITHGVMWSWGIRYG